MLNQHTDIGDLPEDMLCEIFDHLTPRQVLAISTANRTFHRSALKWLQSVGDLTINQNTFTLSKRLANHVSSSDFDLPLPFHLSFFDPILAKCPNIESITLTELTPLNTSLLISLISRCASFKYLDFNFTRRLHFLPRTYTYDLSFTDEEWNRLLQLLQHRSVSISVLIIDPNVNHLEQLLKAGDICVKKFHLTIANRPVLKLLSFIAAETFLSVDLTSFDGTINREDGDLISERVNQLEVNLKNFHSIKASAYPQLTTLTVSGTNNNQTNYQKTELPQLKSLTIRGRVKLNVLKSFFSRKLKRLDQFSISIGSGGVDEKSLTALLKLTPNVTRFVLDVYGGSGLEPGQRGFRIPTRSLDELKLVEFFKLKFWMRYLYKNIWHTIELLDSLAKMTQLKRLTLDLHFLEPVTDQLTKRLAGGLDRFHRRQPSVEVDITIDSIGKNQTSLEEFESKNWPNNFKVCCKQRADLPPN